MALSHSASRHAGGSDLALKPRCVHRCAEMSGMSWSGFTAEESGVKSWAEMKLSGIAPFGQ